MYYQKLTFAIILLFCTCLIGQPIEWKVDKTKSYGEYKVSGDPSTKQGAVVEFQPTRWSKVRFAANAKNDLSGKRLKLVADIESSNAETEISVGFVVNGDKKLIHLADRRLLKPLNNKIADTYSVIFDMPQEDVKKVSLSVGCGSQAVVKITNLYINAVSKDVPISVKSKNGWFKAGNAINAYKVSGSPTEKHASNNPGYIESINPAENDFGNYMTGEYPGKFLGKRIRYSAFIKTENAEGAGLWFRTDGKKNNALTFDNMADRLIKGTSGWKKYEIIIDIPDSTVEMFYGLLSGGNGKAWFDGVNLEVVDKITPITSYNPFGNFVNGQYELCLKIPDSYDVYYRFIKYFAFYKLGKEKEAQEYLNSLSAPEDKEWTKKVISFLKNQISEDDFLKLAADTDPDRQSEKQCEAYYYIGMSYYLPLTNIQQQANPEKAKTYFEKCLATGQSDFIEYGIANVELKKLQK